MHVKIKKGLDIPIDGEPEQTVHEGPEIRSVAVLARDYIDLKPTLLVQEGDRVRLGQALFTDKRHPEVTVTAPGSGLVRQIHRGEKRMLESVVIELEGDEEETFAAFPRDALSGLDRDEVVRVMVDSGLWTALRTRPYSKAPPPDAAPAAIFVSAMDTNPLAADPAVVIGMHSADFVDGVTVLSRLTDGKVYVCAAGDAAIPPLEQSRAALVRFSGPHPAGLVGTQIHFLNPVDAHTVVWHLNYQDVIALGKLFTTGRLWVERIVALGGPVVLEPRLVRTRLGANLGELVHGGLHRGESRIVSGSVLSGRRAVGPVNFLGRYHLQVTVLREGRDRHLLGWIAPGRNKFSAINVFVSSVFGRGKRFALTTSQNGSPRAMVPIGNYEEVVPLDILPTQLLRALIVRDTDTAQKLGCLELDEEDLALCSFVCASKYDFGPALRVNLSQIEKEG